MNKNILTISILLIAASINSCKKETSTTQATVPVITKEKHLSFVPVKGFEISQPSVTGPVTSLAFDSSGTAYAIRRQATAHSESIIKYSNGRFSTVYAVPAPYNPPTGDYDVYDLSKRLVVDSKGNAYVGVTNTWSDNAHGEFPQYRSSVILKITPDGTVSTFAGGDAGNQDGNGQSAKFNNIVDLSIDGNDNIIAGDAIYNGTSNSIRKITPAGDVTTVANLGANLTSSVAADRLGNIYVGYTLLAGHIYANTEVDKISTSGASKGLFFQLDTYDRNYGPLITDKDNNLWLSGAYFPDETGGINVYGSKDGYLLGYNHNLTPFYSIAFDRSWRIYIIGQSSISQYKVQ